MKRFVLSVCAALSLVLAMNGSAHASWGSLSYGGYQPWWNPFGWKNKKCWTCEEERLQRFWHDYYSALKCYYCALDKIDWVAYYKNHGYQINGGCCGNGGCGPGGGGGCQRVNYAPVFVAPAMQWAIPNACMSGPPSPGGGGCCGPMGGGGY